MFTTTHTSLYSTNTVRGIHNATRDINDSLLKLSTGELTNKAGDNISNLRPLARLESEILSLGKAFNNISEGQSLLETADTALEEVSDIILEMRELAISASSATLSSADRASAINEFGAAIAAIQTISATTNFGDYRLLTGSFQGKFLQTGINRGNVVTLSIPASGTAQLGAYRFTGSTRAALTASQTPSANSTTDSEDIVISSNGTSMTIDVSDNDSAMDVAGKINAIADTTLVNAEARTFAHFFSTNANSETYTVKINDFTTGSFSISSSDVSDAVAKINLISDSTGVSATATTTNRVLLQNSTGEDITIENQASGTNLDVQAVQSDGSTNQGNAISLADGTASNNDATRVIGTLLLNSRQLFSITQSGSTSTGYLTTGQASLTDLKSTSIADDTIAADAVSTLDRASEMVTVTRGLIGAKLSALDFSASAILVAQQNKMALETTLNTVDFALESARLSRAMVLRQINTALLSQVNAGEALVLKLVSEP